MTDPAQAPTYDLLAHARELLSDKFSRTRYESKLLDCIRSLVAGIEERDRRIDKLDGSCKKFIADIKELRAQLAQAREALDAISKQALYEWGEKRESLCDIIDACRDVARAALARTGGEEQ